MDMQNKLAYKNINISLAVGIKHRDLLSAISVLNYTNLISKFKHQIYANYTNYKYCNQSKPEFYSQKSKSKY